MINFIKYYYMRVVYTTVGIVALGECSKYFYRHCESTHQGVRVSAVSSLVFLFSSGTSPSVSRRCCTKAPAYFIGQRELQW